MPEHQTQNNASAISEAAKRGVGSDIPDAGWGWGRTPLSIAAERGRVGVMKLLLAHGADTASLDHEGRTSLDWAVWRGSDKAAYLLLRRGSQWRDGYRPLLGNAAIGGLSRVTQFLLDNQVDPDFADEYGRTPLMIAAKNDHFRIVAMLLQTERVDINARIRSGWTPLSKAAAHADDEGILSILLDAGADVDTKDDRGRTPLFHAVYNRLYIYKFLLLRGADPFMKDAEGRTPESEMVVRENNEPEYEEESRYEGSGCSTSDNESLDY
ncbi:ankyrin repeat-containing domain protein [Aspergillus cavernicola]|uniref:Ankyrin repeat-containing domain protein n=1 Tax=Aspergillus cavernicola TaxID=176166 RepID=A0ABR4IT50_9EURO